MAGAYVAKPAEVSVDTKPVGWDGDWPFPGPLPPGYSMDLSLNLTAVAIYTPGAAHDATVSLRDQIDFGTTEPDGPNEITWTATLDGTPMQLKLSGGVYASYIESNYADIGDYWGAEPTFVFPVTIFDGGSVITLAASSVNPFIGYVAGDTSVNIAVYDPVFSLSMSADSPIDWDETSAVEVILEDHGSSWTTEPVGYELTFTATVNGRECMDSLTVDYSAVGDSWGHADDFTFDLTEDDAEKTITLSVEGTVWGDEVSDSVDIEINAAAYPESFVANVVLNSSEINAASLMKVRLKITRTPTTIRDWPQFGATEYGAPPPTWWSAVVDDDISEITSTAEASESGARIDAFGDFEDDYTYTFNYDANEGGNATISVTWTMEVTMSDGTVYSDSETFTITPWGDTVYATSLISRITDVVYIFGVRVN